MNEHKIGNHVERYEGDNPFPESVLVNDRWTSGTDFALRILSPLLLFLACCTPIVDSDFWWHLKTGEMIFDQARLPYHDWFTYTDSHRPWIDLHWGFQLLVAMLYQLGGAKLIVCFKATVLTLAVVVAWHAGGRGLPLWLRTTFWILPAIVISARSIERPEILSMLFLALWLWILNGLDEKPGRLWLLPILQVVWVNCHALSVLGVAVGVCFAVDLVVRIIWKGRLGLSPAPLSLQNKRTLMVGGFVVAANFLNPYFIHGALFPFELYRKLSVDRQIYATVAEFRRPFDLFWDRTQGPGGWLAGMFDVYFCAEVVTWGMTLFSFVCLMFYRKTWSPFRILLFAGFSLLAWQAVRNSNIFSIVCGIILCANCEEAWRGSMTWQTKRLQRSLATCLVLLGLMGCVTLDLWAMMTLESKIVRFGEGLAWFAHDAAKFAGQPGFPNHAFIAHNGQAAVYIYHNGPERRVFIDTRLEVTSRETFDAYARICKQMARSDSSWESEVRGENDDYPVVILDTRYSNRLIKGLLDTPGWRLVFADPAAVVFLQEKAADQLKLAPVNPASIPTPPHLWDLRWPRNRRS